MTALTALQIAAACGASLTLAAACADGLNQAMARYAIDTPARQGMFLANIGHETGGLKWLSEIWGPNDAQRRYERDFSQPWPSSPAEARLPAFQRNRLAYNLGNDRAGDGSFYRGHGMLQTTGRYNHAKVRDRLRERFPDLEVPDFESQPQLLARPEWAALAAADYVDMKGCNAMADAGDFDGYCDLVNRGRKTEDEGDSNGWEHRLVLWLGIDEGRALA